MAICHHYKGILPVLAFAAAAHAAVDFIHVTDVHIADLEAVEPALAAMRHKSERGAKALEAALRRIGASASFVLLTGDVVDAWCFDGRESGSVYGQVDAAKRVLDAAQAPVYVALGNHDVQCYRRDPARKGPAADASVAAEARRDWAERVIGHAPYYAIPVRSGAASYRILVLDNGDAAKNPGYANSQLEWLAAELRKTKDTVIVAMHVPLGANDFSSRMKAALAAAPHVALVIAGHMHTDAIEDVDVGGRTVVQVRGPALAAGESNWRRIRLREDAIEIFAAGPEGRPVRTIPTR